MTLKEKKNSFQDIYDLRFPWILFSNTLGPEPSYFREFQLRITSSAWPVSSVLQTSVIYTTSSNWLQQRASVIILAVIQLHLIPDSVILLPHNIQEGEEISHRWLGWNTRSFMVSEGIKTSVVYFLSCLSQLLRHCCGSDSVWSLVTKWHSCIHLVWLDWTFGDFHSFNL